MRTFIIITRTADDRPIRFELDAADAGAAVKLALDHLIHGNEVEVWQGTELIITLKPPKA